MKLRKLKKRVNRCYWNCVHAAIANGFTVVHYVRRADLIDTVMVRYMHPRTGLSATFLYTQSDMTLKRMEKLVKKANTKCGGNTGARVFGRTGMLIERPRVQKVITE